MLRCGRIEYTNDLPIYAAFDAHALVFPGTLHSDVPANLNAMMLRGDLDVSPISAFAYAKNPDRFVLLPDLCIGARREVISVVLVSDTPPALLDGATIALSAESASGANFLKVLLAHRYGVHAKFSETSSPLHVARSGAPVLLIGDGAIDAALEFPTEHVYDLGVMWHDWTGEQTVFAVWAARREIYEVHPDAVRACMHALTDAYTWGHSHLRAVIAQAQALKPRPAGFYENYFAKLNFAFHSAAQSGLAAYCRELAALGVIDRVPPTTPEVIGVAS